jgi:hypothetical protein
MKLDALLRHIDTIGDPFLAVGLPRNASDAQVEDALAKERKKNPRNPAIPLLADTEVRARIRLLLPVPATDPEALKAGVRRELGYVGPGLWRGTIRALSMRKRKDNACNRSR